MNLERVCNVACRTWAASRAAQVTRVLSRLSSRELPSRLRSRVFNALGVCSMIEGSAGAGRSRDLFQAAMGIDPPFEAAARNLGLLADFDAAPDKAKARVATVSALSDRQDAIDVDRGASLSRALNQAGHETRHIVVKLAEALVADLEIPRRVLDLTGPSRTPFQIQKSLSSAVAEFDPDCVILGGQADVLPLLAAGVRDFPYILGPDIADITALHDRSAGIRNDVAAPDAFRWAGVGTLAFDDQLRQALWDAEEVLVPTPESQWRLAPYARSVRVIPWGVDISTFAEPMRELSDSSATLKICLVGMGNLDHQNASFQSLLRAQLRLTQNSSITIEVTFLGTARSSANASTGALVKAAPATERARLFQAADVVVFLSNDGPQAQLAALIAEAMACGRPAVVGRNEITSYLVADGVDGMMFEPEHPVDLIRVLTRFAADPQMRRDMGEAARRSAKNRFSWDVMIERAFAPVVQRFAARRGRVAMQGSPVIG
jgi:hypothetical protein